VSKKSKSTTERETTLVDRIFNWPGHYLTEISDGKSRVRHRDNHADEAQKQASKKWGKIKKK